MIHIIKVLLTHIRQERNRPVCALGRYGPVARFRAYLARRKALFPVMVVLDRQPNLLQVVLALRPSRGLPRSLHGRQEQSDQACDNGDHNQEFDQRETVCQMTPNKGCLSI